MPDKAAAFDILAARWLRAKKDKELTALLNEQGKEHAAEPIWQYYTGELQLQQGDAAAATKSFAAALARTPAPQDWRYRNGLYRARGSSWGKSRLFTSYLGRIRSPNLPGCALRIRMPNSCKP